MNESLYVGEQKRKGLYGQHPLKDERPGKDPAEEIMKENRKNCTDRITGQKLDESFAQIADIIKALPDAAELRKLYQSLGIKSSL